MNWFTPIDAYCERTGPEFWAEPVNALTNAAFLVAAVVMWRRMDGGGPPLARLLVAILFVIGVGSFLFHTFAMRWAALADVLPIAAFILVYLYVANRFFWGWPDWAAGLGTVAFIPYAAALQPVFAALPFFAISAVYWPVPLLILIHAVLLRRRAPATARGLALGAALLCLSLALRSLDAPACAVIPVGTHPGWHLLNALMLGWMIEVYRTHMLAARAGQG